MNQDPKMLVGTLRLRLIIRGSRSLKDKRRTVRSVKDRIRNKFNASVAEIASLDLHQVAELGVAVVGNDRTYLQSVLSQIANLVALQARDAELASCDMEIQ